MPYIISKLANAQCYTQWVKGVNNINQLVSKVEIKGGADVINKKTLETPQGVVTEVTEQQLEILKQNCDFQKHFKNGFLTIIENKPSEEKVAEKAEKLKKDASKQKTKKDYQNKKDIKPIENEDNG